MKRLDEILSKRGSDATLADLSATSLSEDPEPAEVCPICHGGGFVRRARPLDHPLFGRVEPCDCVLAEPIEARTSRLERLSNLGSLTRFTFATLDDQGRDGNSPWFERAIETARAYADGPKGWLVLTGASGGGKTHLAAAIANRRIELGQPAIFMVVPDLLDHLRSSYDAGEEELGFADLFEQVRTTPLLLLDDIDAAAGTPWAKEKLFQVVNHRYNAELPTVFTTSLHPRQLEDRIATRLLDERLAQLVVLAGPSGGAYRQVGGMSRERLAEMQFRDFDLRGTGLNAEERHSLESAFRSAQAYGDAPRGWFVLQGANGCGKTHLAAAIANRVLGNGGDVFFAVVPDLLDYLRASFAPDKEVGYDELFEQIRNAGVLVLDDLGAQTTSPWAQEKLYQIVNYRTVSGLPTVVTTDRSTQELSAVHPRIMARIADPSGGNFVGILAPHYSLGRTLDPPPRTAYRRR